MKPDKKVLDDLLDGSEELLFEPFETIRPYEKEIGDMSHFEKILYKIAVKYFMKKAIHAGNWRKLVKEQGEKKTRKELFNFGNVSDGGTTALASLIHIRLGNKIPIGYNFAFRKGFKIVVLDEIEEKIYTEKHGIPEDAFFPFTLPGPTMLDINIMGQPGQA